MYLEYKITFSRLYQIYYISLLELWSISIYSGDKLPYIDKPVDKYPVHVKQEKTDRSVLIVQASAFTRFELIKNW